FALRDDKEWFGFRDTLVAYRVHNGIALVSPDPIGPVGQRAEAWGAFREFADEHGWPVAVMGASQDWLPAYRASGMHDLYIGDEAVVDVRRFSLDGKQNKSLRQSVARVEKSGYHVDFFDPTKLDETLRTQLRELMSDSMQIESLWSFNEKFLPERHPHYACYDSPEHLLSAWIAVARAESFFELPFIGRFFVPKTDDPSGRPAQLPVDPEPVAT